MKNRIAIIVGAFLMVSLLFNTSYSFDDGPKKDKSNGYVTPGLDEQKRTQWSFNIMYGEKGFGLTGEYHVNVWKNTDFFAGLGFSGVTDDREFQEYDIFGNSYTPNKVNRVFMAPLSLGFTHAMFQDDIDGSLKPTISFGVAPTLVLTNPYSTSFFPALGKFQAAFAMGPFAGIGMDFNQNNKVAFSFNVNYYYLPVIGKEVMSIENTPIKNVGGLQFTIGVNLLH